MQSIYISFGTVASPDYIMQVFMIYCGRLGLQCFEVFSPGARLNRMHPSLYFRCGRASAMSTLMGPRCL